MSIHKQTNEFDRLYDELVSVSNKIRPYYDIDKVKPYSVYIWTKDKENDFGENVFDIEIEDIAFYDKKHKIIEDALPIIKEIQYKLKELKEVRGLK